MRVVRRAALVALLLAACEGGTAPDAQPEITGIAPRALAANQAASLQVTGKNLSAETRATFDGTEVRASVSSPTTVAVEVPATLLLAPHLARLTVKNGTLSAFVDLQVFAERPTISGTEPEHVRVGEPRRVTVRGHGFLPTTRVTLRSEPVATTYVSATELTLDLTAAQTAEPGLLLLLVANGDASLTQRLELPVWPEAPTWSGLPASLEMAPVSATAVQASLVDFTGTELFPKTTATVTEGRAQCSLHVTSRTAATLACAPTVPVTEAAGQTFTVKLQSVGPGRESAPHTFTWHLPRPQLASPRTHYLPSGTAPIRVEGLGVHPDSKLLLGGSALGEEEVAIEGAWRTRFLVTPAARSGTLSFTIENPGPGGGAAEPLALAPIAGTELGAAPALLAADRVRPGHALLARPGGSVAWVGADGTALDLGVVPTAIESSPGARVLALLHPRGVVFLDNAGTRAPLEVATPDAPLDVFHSSDSAVAVVRTASRLVHVTLATGAETFVDEPRPATSIVPHLLDHPTRLVVARSKTDAGIVDFAADPPAITPVARLQDTPIGLLPDGTTVVEPRRLVTAAPMTLPGRVVGASADGKVVACGIGQFTLVRVDVTTGAELDEVIAPEPFFAEPHPTGLLLGSRYFRGTDGALLEVPGPGPRITSDGAFLVAATGGLASRVRTLEVATGTVRSAPGDNAHLAGERVVYERPAANGRALVLVPVAALGTDGQGGAELVANAYPAFDEAAPVPGSARVLLRSAFETESQWVLFDHAQGVRARFEPGTDVAALDAARVLTLEESRAVVWSP